MKFKLFDSKCIVIDTLQEGQINLFLFTKEKQSSSQKTRLLVWFGLVML